jgi:hypothetical protein
LKSLGSPTNNALESLVAVDSQELCMFEVSTPFERRRTSSFHARWRRARLVVVGCVLQGLAHATIADSQVTTRSVDDCNGVAPKPATAGPLTLTIGRHKLLFVKNRDLSNGSSLTTKIRDAKASELVVLSGIEPRPQSAANAEVQVPIVRLGTHTSLSRSALYSVPSPSIGEEVARGRLHIVGLVDPSREEPLIAAVATEKTGALLRTSIVWHSKGVATADAARLDVAALEHLYAVVLRQEADQRFDLGVFGPRPAIRGVSQSSVLEAIARQRMCAATQLSRQQADLAPTPWHPVSMRALRAKRAGDKYVAVAVRDTNGQPIASGSITFARGAHLMCSSQTDAKGNAACTLWYSHPPDGDSDEDSRAPTIATFAGIVTPSRVTLPTTLVFGGSQ